MSRIIPTFRQYISTESGAILTIFSAKDFLPSEAFPFTIQTYTIQPEEVIPLHTHDFIELVFVASGNATHVIADESYLLKGGDVFVIEPSVYHSYCGSENHATTVYNVLFNLDFIRKDLQSLMDMSSFIHLFYLAPFLRRTSGFVPYLALTPEESARLDNYLKLLLTEVEQQDSGYELASKTLLINTLVFLSRCYEKHHQETQASTRVRSDMETIMAFIRENHDSPLSVRHISKSFGIGVTTLLTKFKQHTGMTVLEYKHQIQIQEACQQLINTDDKILSIAQSVGFDDLSFFYRVFRRVTGMTPKQYRSKIK